MMQQPSLKPRPTLDKLGIKCRPIYLRKLNSKRAWDPENISESAKLVFPKQTNSLFLVLTDEDLYKVTAALNSGKELGGMNAGAFFIWIAPDEMQKCEISLRPERDEQQIKCPAGQKLHMDAAGEDALWLRLSRLLAAGDRLVRITDGQMKSINQWLRPKGCWSYRENQGGKCDLCPWATGRLMRLFRWLSLMFDEGSPADDIWEHHT